MKVGKLYTDFVFGGVYRFEGYHTPPEGRPFSTISFLEMTVIIGSGREYMKIGDRRLMTPGYEYRLKEL